MAMAHEDKGEHGGLSGWLGGFTALLESLEKLAEGGAELHRTGTIPSSATGENPAGPGEGEASRAPRGVFGVSVKMGLGGGQDFRVEPFGNVRRDRSTGASVVEEVREPLIDVFDEGDRLLVVAEMPGVESEDVHVDLDGRLLTVTAERADRKYRKSIEVPEGTRRERLSVSCNNGIVEIGVAKPQA
jgi:HSP20 family protein